MEVWDLERLLAPCDKTRFLTDFLSRSPVVASGASNKWSGLCSWNILNDILSHCALTFPRARLVMNGVDIPEAAYFSRGSSGYPRLIISEVNRCLHEGASLVVDSAGSLSRPLSEFCRAVERDLGVPLEAEIVSRFVAENDPDPMWNDHEMIVLQAAGSSDWQIYAPTNMFANDRSVPPRPSGEPKAMKTIETGSLLYVPRGWWYRSRCRGAGELMLILSFRNPSAMDVAYGIIARCNEIPAMRADYPQFGGIESQSGFLTMLQAELSRAIGAAGVISGCVKSSRAAADPLSTFGLPWSAMHEPIDYPDELVILPLIRFPGPDSISPRADADDFEIFHEGNMIRLSPATAAVLREVCQPVAGSVGALVKTCSAGRARPELISDIALLLGHGLITLEEARHTEGASLRQGLNGPEIPGLAACQRA